MNKLPKPPKVTLTKQQKAILNNFPKEISGWKSFLKELGFEVETLDTYDPESHGYDNDSAIVFNNGINGYLTPNEGAEKGLIITSGSFVSVEQFLSKRYWPDVFKDEMPSFLEADFFIKNKARILFSKGLGMELFNRKKYLLKTEPHSRENTLFEGTWQQVAKKLISIKAEMATNLLTERLK